jgi:hypothetical protein
VIPALIDCHVRALWHMAIYALGSKGLRLVVVMIGSGVLVAQVATRAQLLNWFD